MRGFLLKALLLIAMAMAWPTSAQAFYWAGWPGSGVYEPQSITPRQIPSTPTLPKTNPPPTTPPTPQEVPEPATFVIAGLGLGVLGLRKVLKRKK